MLGISKMLVMLFRIVLVVLLVRSFLCFSFGSRKCTWVSMILGSMCSPSVSKRLEVAVLERSSSADTLFSAILILVFMMLF